MEQTRQIPKDLNDLRQITVAGRRWGRPLVGEGERRDEEEAERVVPQT